MPPAGRRARTGRVAGDRQPARLELLGGRLLGVAECLKLVQRCSKATASDPELLMVVITLAEQRTVQWQYTNREPSDIDHLHRSAR
jgi:hypothetical protein